MAAEKEDGQSLYPAFLLALVIIALPVKNLAYIAPPLYVAFRWLQGDNRLLRRVFMLTCVLVVVSAISLLADHVAGHEVSLPGVAFAVLTYGSLIVALCHSYREEVSDDEFGKFVTACCWFVIVQALIGFLQFAASGNPDAVCGTYGLLDGFVGSITIAQVYLTFTLFCMMLFIAINPLRLLSVAALVLGAVVCVLAQSGHQTIFFVFTLCICSVLWFGNLKALIASSVGATALIGLVLFVYPNTVANARGWYEKTVVNTDRSLKAKTVDDSIEIMSRPKNLLFGVGLGQYTSRASLIASGEYLNVDLPNALADQSRYYRKYTRPLLYDFEEIGEASAIAKPHMTAVSVPVEVGVPLFVALMFSVAIAMRRSLTFSRSSRKVVARIGLTSMIGVVFFSLCCLVENYAEFSQAIFLPSLLLVVASCRATRISREMSIPRLSEPSSII